MTANEKSNCAYTIRNYQPEDFDKYVLLNTEAEELEPSGRCTSPQGIAEHLGRPNYSPEQDLFVAEMAENIVGFMDVIPELNIEHVILDCWIHPAHRRRGLATKFLDYATHRAKKLGARLAHVSIMEDNIIAKEALSRLGFSLVQKFFELSLDITHARWLDINRAATECRHLTQGEEDKLTQIQNRAFAGAWGFNPNTVEEITYRANSSACSPEDIILLQEGNKIVGYCWTGAVCEGRVTSERTGRIYMLGVDPDYRNRGIGKKVLLAGLARLKSRGLQIAELTVYSDNKAARALYKSIGFKIRTSGFWYEKAIN